MRKKEDEQKDGEDEKIKNEKNAPENEENLNNQSGLSILSFRSNAPLNVTNDGDKTQEEAAREEKPKISWEVSREFRFLIEGFEDKKLRHRFTALLFILAVAVQAAACTFSYEMPIVAISFLILTTLVEVVYCLVTQPVEEAREGLLLVANKVLTLQSLILVFVYGFLLDETHEQARKVFSWIASCLILVRSLVNFLFILFFNVIRPVYRACKERRRANAEKKKVSHDQEVKGESEDEKNNEEEIMSNEFDKAESGVKN